MYSWTSTNWHLLSLYTLLWSQPHTCTNTTSILTAHKGHLLGWTPEGWEARGRPKVTYNVEKNARERAEQCRVDKLKCSKSNCSEWDGSQTVWWHHVSYHVRADTSSKLTQFQVVRVCVHTRFNSTDNIQDRWIRSSYYFLCRFLREWLVKLLPEELLVLFWKWSR